MNEPYAAAPHITPLPIPERVEYLRRATLLVLRRQQSTVALVLDAVEQMLEDEQYELVQGVQLAVKEFQADPQLELF